MLTVDVSKCCLHQATFACISSISKVIHKVMIGQVFVQAATEWLMGMSRNVYIYFI